MLSEEKAAFWERLSELGFIVYKCEDYKTIVSKYATPLDDSDFEESFTNKTEAVEKVKKLINWIWEQKTEEVEQKQIFKVKISITYKVPSGLNSAEIGEIEYIDQDEAVKEAERLTKIYFSKNYPNVNQKDIKISD